MSGAQTADEPRTTVRVAFWAAVCILWAPLAFLAAVALLWAAAATGLWQVPPLPDNPDSQAVTKAWGEPDDVIRDPSTISSFFDNYAECPVAEAAEVWLYNRFVLPDSAVFVGARHNVVCAVRTRGMHFVLRSH